MTFNETVEAVMRDTSVRRSLVALVWRVGVDCFGVGPDNAGAGAMGFEACIQPDGSWAMTDRGDAAKAVVKEIVSATLIQQGPNDG